MSDQLGHSDLSGLMDWAAMTAVGWADGRGGVQCWEWTRGGTRGTSLHGECAAAWLTKCIDPWKITHILRDFYREFKVRKARAFTVCPFKNYFHVIATNKKRKMVASVDFRQNWLQNQLLVYLFKTYFLCQGIETCNYFFITFLTICLISWGFLFYSLPSFFFFLFFIYLFLFFIFIKELYVYMYYHCPPT